MLVTECAGGINRLVAAADAAAKRIRELSEACTTLHQQVHDGIKRAEQAEYERDRWKTEAEVLQAKLAALEQVTVAALGASR